MNDQEMKFFTKLVCVYFGCWAVVFILVVNVTGKQRKFHNIELLRSYTHTNVVPGYVYGHALNGGVNVAIWTNGAFRTRHHPPQTNVVIRHVLGYRERRTHVELMTIDTPQP